MWGKPVILNHHLWLRGGVLAACMLGMMAAPAARADASASYLSKFCKSLPVSRIAEWNPPSRRKFSFVYNAVVTVKPRPMPRAPRPKPQQIKREIRLDFTLLRAAKRPGGPTNAPDSRRLILRVSTFVISEGTHSRRFDPVTCRATVRRSGLHISDTSNSFLPKVLRLVNACMFFRLSPKNSDAGAKHLNTYKAIAPSTALYFGNAILSKAGRRSALVIRFTATPRGQLPPIATEGELIGTARIDGTSGWVSALKLKHTLVNGNQTTVENYVITQTGGSR